MIEDVQGLDGSRVFGGVELEDDETSLIVHITREATLELGVTVIESGELCGDEDFPYKSEWELRRGERTAYIPVGCSDVESIEVDIAAVGPANQVVDSLVVYLAYT